MSVERADPCERCGAGLDRVQRYCLGCGARIFAPSAQLLELQRRVRARFAAADRGLGPPAEAGGPPGPPDQTYGPPGPPTEALVRANTGARQTAGRASARRPGPRVAALLVLVFLGFGVLLGGAAGSPVAGGLAASARRLEVVLPHSTAPSGPSAAAEAAPAGDEAPEAEAEPTPAPAPAGATTSAAASAPRPAAAPSAAAGGGEGAAPAPAPGGSASSLPPIKHVFVIMLSDQPYASVFGPASSAPYLSRTLERRGELLVRYDAVAHEELANELALISGQGPTAQTAANCPSYTDLAPATVAAEEQLLGSGCVYPSSTQTLPGELTARKLTWRAYVGGLGETGTPAGACAHPPLGAPDPSTGPAPPGTGYATSRDPFVYFHSVIDSPACAAGVVGVKRLQRDLDQAAHTPSFSYIAPDGCHDGSPVACAPGAPAGMAPADGLLKTVVPRILRSAAYRVAGLLVITVDEAPSSGELADSSACCGQPQFPNLSAPASGLPPRGGGTVGALLLSPFIKAATTSQEAFNHFSLLRTVEDLFKVKHLGYAGLPAVKPFEASMFTVAPHR